MEPVGNGNCLARKVRQNYSVKTYPKRDQNCTKTGAVKERFRGRIFANWLLQYPLLLTKHLAHSDPCHRNGDASEASIRQFVVPDDVNQVALAVDGDNGVRRVYHLIGMRRCWRSKHEELVTVQSCINGDVPARHRDHPCAE